MSSSEMGGFTPGPWIVNEDDCVVSAETWLPIKHYSGLAEDAYAANDATPESTANARLIAAAPELLEALEAAIGVWAFRCTDEPQQVWLAMARAAIAKGTDRG